MKRLLLFLAMTLAGFAQVQAGTPVQGPQTTPARGQNPSQKEAGQTKPPTQKDADCGCEVKVPQDVLAVVNGVKVAVKDVDQELKDRVQELQKQVVEARKGQLEA